MQENWDGVEKSLRQLLGMLKKKLSPSEYREVADFIEGNELEAAMEALVDILVDKKEPLSKQALEAARRAATALELPAELVRINKKLV